MEAARALVWAMLVVDGREVVGVSETDDAGR